MLKRDLIPHHLLQFPLLILQQPQLRLRGPVRLRIHSRLDGIRLPNRPVKWKGQVSAIRGPNDGLSELIDPVYQSQFVAMVYVCHGNVDGKGPVSSISADLDTFKGREYGAEVEVHTFLSLDR